MLLAEPVPRPPRPMLGHLEYAAGAAAARGTTACPDIDAVPAVHTSCGGARPNGSANADAFKLAAVARRFTFQFIAFFCRSDSLTFFRGARFTSVPYKTACTSSQPQQRFENVNYDRGALDAVHCGRG